MAAGLCRGGGKEVVGRIVIGTAKPASLPPPSTPPASPLAYWVDTHEITGSKDATPMPIVFAGINLEHTRVDARAPRRVGLQRKTIAIYPHLYFIETDHYLDQNENQHFDSDYN